MQCDKQLNMCTINHCTVMTFECIECTMLPYLLLFNGGTWNQMGKKFSGSWKAVYCHNDTIFVTSIGVARGWEEILLKKGQSEVRLSFQQKLFVNELLFNSTNEMNPNVLRYNMLGMVF